MKKILVAILFVCSGLSGLHAQLTDPDSIINGFVREGLLEPRMEAVVRTRVAASMKMMSSESVPEEIRLSFVLAKYAKKPGEKYLKELNEKIGRQGFGLDEETMEKMKEQIREATQKDTEEYLQKLKRTGFIGETTYSDARNFITENPDGISMLIVYCGIQELLKRRYSASFIGRFADYLQSNGFLTSTAHSQLIAKLKSNSRMLPSEVVAEVKHACVMPPPPSMTGAAPDFMPMATRVAELCPDLKIKVFKPGAATVYEESVIRLNFEWNGKKYDPSDKGYDSDLETVFELCQNEPTAPIVQIYNGINRILADAKSEYRLHFFAINWEPPTMNRGFHSQSATEKAQMGFIYLKKSEEIKFFHFDPDVPMMIAAQFPSYQLVDATAIQQFFASVKSQGLASHLDEKTLARVTNDALYTPYFSPDELTTNWLGSLVNDEMVLTENPFSEGELYEPESWDKVEADTAWVDPAPAKEKNKKNKNPERSLVEHETILNRYQKFTRNAFQYEKFEVKFSGKGETIETVSFKSGGEKWKKEFTGFTVYETEFKEWVEEIITKTVPAGKIYSLEVPGNSFAADMSSWDSYATQFSINGKIFLTAPQYDWLKAQPGVQFLKP